MWISTTRRSFIPKYARSLLHRYITATRVLHELSCSARWPHPHPRLSSVTVSRTTPVINNTTYVLLYDQKVPASNEELIVFSVAGLGLGYIGRRFGSIMFDAVLKDALALFPRFYTRCIQRMITSTRWCVVQT
jgi:hypothetical protein